MSPRSCGSSRKRGHHELLIFNRVEGFKTPVVTNLFASRERVARMLGTDVAHLHATYQARARNLLAPELAGTGPVLDEVLSGDEVDLSTQPLITHFESDASGYITSGIIYAEHPDTKVGNLSYHRAQLHTNTELATSLHSRGHLWQMLNAARTRGPRSPPR